MRHSFLTAALLFLPVLSVIAQPPPEVIWQMYLTDSSYMIVENMFTTREGTFLVEGSGTGSREYDENGEVVNTGSSAQLTELQTLDNGFFCTSPNVDHRKRYRDLSWNWTFPNGNDEPVDFWTHAILEISSGVYALAGFDQSLDVGNFAIRGIAEPGVEEFYWDYPEYEGSHLPDGIFHTNQGGMFVAGSGRPSWTTSEEETWMMLAEIDQDGEILRYLQWDPDGRVPYSTNRAMHHPDGGFTLGGPFFTTNGDTLNLVRIQNNGDVKWTVRAAWSTPNLYYADVLPAKDGGYFVCTIGIEYCAVGRLNANGEMLYQRLIGFNPQHIGGFEPMLAMLPGESPVFGSTVRNVNYPDIIKHAFLARLDSWTPPWVLSADAGADTITVQAGQPFTWTGTVRNTLADDQSTDIWVQARGPNYNITNSLRRWDDVTVAGGDSVSADVTLTVPATAHNGPHNLLLRVGDFPLYDYEAWFTVMVEGGEPPPDRHFAPVHQQRELVATPIPSDEELATDRAEMFRMLGVTDTTASVDAWQPRVRRVNRAR